MNITSDIQNYLLVFFRFVSVLWLLPIFAYRFISVPFKASLSMAIAYLLYDTVSLPLQVSGPYDLAILLCRESFLGLLMGFVVRVLFVGVQAAGEIVAMQAGFSFSRIMDPSTMTQISVIEQFKNVLAIMVFFGVNAHHALINSVVETIRLLPPGSFTLNKSLIVHLITITGKIFVMGLKIGAPVIGTLFVVEVALGIMARMVPQVNVFVEGMTVKTLLTVSLLSLSLSFTVPLIADMFRGIPADMAVLMKLMR
jgi:flagellar biosynthetic protein FliR